jgi:hypothetical protein
MFFLLVPSLSNISSRLKTGFLGLQCCHNHIEAAQAGHIPCLERLKEDGRLLTTDHYFRSSQNKELSWEAQKFELWDAALVACKAGHAPVLTWLFGNDMALWPSVVDAKPAHSLSGLAQPLEWSQEEKLHLPYIDRHDWYHVEVNLCHFAVINPSTACLKALLKAGCRSLWICLLAAREGREEHFALAVQHRCSCDPATLYFAAKGGNVNVLQAAQRHAKVALILFNHDCVITAAAKGGRLECLRALLDSFGSEERCLLPAARAAVEGGHLDCVQELVR